MPLAHAFLFAFLCYTFIYMIHDKRQSSHITTVTQLDTLPPCVTYTQRVDIFIISFAFAMLIRC